MMNIIILFDCNEECMLVCTRPIGSNKSHQNCPINNGDFEPRYKLKADAVKACNTYKKICYECRRIINE